jgi:putative nucleotidyltransferase with HDIG domain
MRLPLKARALIIGTVALGSGVLAVAAVEVAAVPLATIALLAAAAVVTELVVVPSDEESLDALDAHAFSFSTGVHVAAVLILGPWAAALVAAFGVLAVDGLRGAKLRQVGYNASVFVLASVGGYGAFTLLGGAAGALELPADFPALAALAATYYTVSTLLVSSVIALSSRTSVWPLARQALSTAAPSAAGEIGLGVALALFAFSEPWAIVVLAPLVLAVYLAHARLAELRRGTARALETFANVVDERDPYTYEHSARVAEYVRELGEALGLPSSEVAKLRRAGRLHDLGKIAVETASLRKDEQLSEEEWVAMRRHPRLSAHLLRDFRFAADEGAAVEYHHERFDGRGYYGAQPDDIPLAAHFLIVADSYDAMTSDRPYRRALPREQALAELEAGAGTQFHPAVAKAFVALQRGLDPFAALTPAERDELGRLSPRRLKALHRRLSAACGRRTLPPARQRREAPT